MSLIIIFGRHWRVDWQSSLLYAYRRKYLRVSLAARRGAAPAGRYGVWSEVAKQRLIIFDIGMKY
jgi:hypothetical protein